MVCKDELCTWFKNLSPHKRIDFMCGMLNMCLPMELRFMGSYVEDLAKKDFHQLRESESKANSRQELSNFNETDGKAFRTKMAVYLALLHSSNRTCSNIIYQLLENNIKDTLTVIEDMNEMTIHNILLVLSMAMNHPAFSYHQKSKMFEYYKAASEATDRIPLKPDPELFAAFIPYDHSMAPAYSPRPPVHVNYSPVINEKVHVCNIEVKGSRVRESEKRTVEYKLQVTWSNGEETEVYKTYKELEDFHNQLMQKFPGESRFSEKSISVPVLQGSSDHTKENFVLLNEYTRSLSELPQHLLQCSFFLSFFTGGTATSSPPVQMMDASTSPRPQSVPDLPAHSTANSGDEESVILSYLNKPQSVCSTYLHQSPASGECSMSPNGPANSDLNVPTTMAHSPSCSTKTTSPLLRSPCHSSASSMESPPPSNPTSPSLQEREANRLLNNHPLYNNLLGQYPTDQLNSMRLEEPEEQNSKETATNMKNMMDTKAREKGLPSQVPNGILEHPVIWPQQFPHNPYLPHHGVAPFQLPPPHQMYGYPVYTSNASPATGQEFSPSNSLHSSPSSSPHSFSDDSEKDKHASQSALNGRGKGHSVPNTARTAQQVKTAEDSSGFQGGNENGNSLQGHSGYTSDPTYNATRPQLIRPSYKAQPAHTSMTIPQKFLMHMPDNFKHGASVVPLAIPQHLTGSYMSDTNQRQLLYFGPNFMNRPYPMNPVNNARQIYGNGLPPINHSLSSTSLAHSSHNTNGNTSKIYQGSTVMHTAQSSPNNPMSGMVKGGVLLNGSESSGQPQAGIDLCPHRTGSSNAVPSTSTVTYTTACQSLPSNHTICTHCGCTGSGTPTTSQPPLLPYPGVAQATQGVWPPYTNGLIPVHHPMFVHPNQYPNGINPELVYNSQYGLMNPGSHGVGVPNVIGYNLYNPGTHNASGGYQKKQKKLNCHNCGSSKHMAGECNEVSMEAMSGQTMYSYKPKSDSD